MEVRAVGLHEERSAGEDADYALAQPVNVHNVVSRAAQPHDGGQISRQTHRQGNSLDGPFPPRADRRQSDLIDVVAGGAEEISLNGSDACDVVNKGDSSH